MSVACKKSFFPVERSSAPNPLAGFEEPLRGGEGRKGREKERMERDGRPGCEINIR